MSVDLIHCGPTANESEEKSFAFLKTRLISAGGDQRWILLANLAFSITHDMKSDEIDLITIGPSGVQVVEIKHWSAAWIKSNPSVVEEQADKLTGKARKIATTLRRVVPDLPFISGAFLLSTDHRQIAAVMGQSVRGIPFYGLNNWKEMIGFEQPRRFTAQQIARMAEVLHPHSKIRIDGSLRRLAGYINLELQSPPVERFRRIYKGKHSSRQDRVILYLYDLSAEDGPKADEKAKRNFQALHQLQLYPWAPRILDSFQEAPGFPGEMFFFTLVDPAVPSLKERAEDTQWNLQNRVAFAKDTLQAVHALHQIDTAQPFLHRDLSPETILVKHDNTPLLTGFDYTRIPHEVSIASSAPPADGTDYMAPEIRVLGRVAADLKSDIYGVCASLALLFDPEQPGQQPGSLSDVGTQARSILAAGMAEDPDDRPSLQVMAEQLSVLLGESIPAPPAPPARFWAEGQTVSFRDGSYRIVSRLGSGGIGMTFKVLQVVPGKGERDETEIELGSYVAKVAHDRERGEQTLSAYRLVRSHLGRTGLSTVFEVASEWQENNFVALMKWIPGLPLHDYQGIFPLLAEDLQHLLADAAATENLAESLALGWLQDACRSLQMLHDSGLIHGDVSPRNLIINESQIVLTDYDFVQRIGQRRRGAGTLIYAAPPDRPASPSDDLFALAASFFHVLFDREPFEETDRAMKRKGLHWAGLQSDEYPHLVDFLNKATDPDPAKRFGTAQEAIAFLAQERQRRADERETAPGPGVAQPDETQDETTPEPPPIAPARATPQPETDERSPSLPPSLPPTLPADGQVAYPQRQPNTVDWLRSVLQSYPGSPWGNRETRGLDSDFATQTYVETALEQTLYQDILQRRLSLVVLCGNAGDGKTALLQHLTQRLGLGQHESSRRILEGQVSNGPFVRMNLDGSAAWNGRSSDDLLNEFLSPFFTGPPQDDRFHLLAINDGRLLEWLDTVKKAQGEQPLFSILYRLLNRESVPAHENGYVRFISLNERSLVGGILPPADGRPGGINTDFVERLTDHLYGGDAAPDYWRPCLSCTAQESCRVFEASKVLGPATLPQAGDPELRSHARQRLFEALQAVHLRGESHITVRELRAALVYILFGIHDCADYHKDQAEQALPYWDRAFVHNSPARQGEVLSELVRFDPALESHAQIDRHLLRQIEWEGDERPQEIRERLASQRRRAYFEGIHEPGDLEEHLTLARGRHLERFRKLPLLPEEERAALRTRLCQGIARLEDLPLQALARPDVVPLRIIPRTPTETAFWVEKPVANFRLEADLPPPTEGVEHLHRQASLIYTYSNGQEERLGMGAELFHVLLELADGYQLGDASNDDIFTNLSIFVQRLVREDEREMLAWNPIRDEAIYRIQAPIRQSGQGPRQVMTIQPIPDSDPGGDYERA